MLLNPSMPAWFICTLKTLDVIWSYVTGRDWGRMQHRRLSSCGVMSAALFIHVPLFLTKLLSLTSWWQASQYPWLSVMDSYTHTHTLAEASSLSLSLFPCSLTAKETLPGLHAWSLFLG